MIKWLRNRVKRTAGAKVSRADVIWCYDRILGRAPESEAAIAAHLSNDFPSLVAAFVGSPEFSTRLSAPVSRADVVWCYEHLLGREPESEAAIALHLTKGFRQLVIDLVASPEFFRNKSRQVSSLGDKASFQRLDAPPIVVETTATAGQMMAAVAKVKATWSHLGSVSPHFSVLTNERFRPENLDGSIAQFWASGEAEAALVQRILERNGCSLLAAQTCVEYGCGVGRVTMGLARRFGRVHGYDISPGHLAHAEQRAAELAVENVVFHRCTDGFADPIENCDVFYSRIVFQHNPPPLIATLLTTALRALKPGGIAIFQVPTYCVGYDFRVDEWLAAGPSADMEMHCLPQDKVFALIALGHCSPLEVWEDNSPGAPDRFISNVFVVRKAV